MWRDAFRSFRRQATSLLIESKVIRLLGGVQAVVGAAAFVVAMADGLGVDPFLVLLPLIAASTFYVAALAFRVVKRTIKRYAFARSEYDGTVATVGEISKRLYDIDKPRWRFTEVVDKTIVSRDGTCVVERHFTLEADSAPAQVWRVQLEADSTAEPIVYVGDIEFNVECDDDQGFQVRYLVSRNDDRSKEICIFFLPEISPGEERIFELSYKWPKFAGDLIMKGATEFYVNYTTADKEDTAKVSLEYWFEKGLGPLEFEQTDGPRTDIRVFDAERENVEFSVRRVDWPDLAMWNRRIAFRVTRKRV